MIADGHLQYGGFLHARKCINVKLRVIGIVLSCFWWFQMIPGEKLLTYVCFKAMKLKET